jgi:vancomycin resistance protein VanW
MTMPITHKAHPLIYQAALERHRLQRSLMSFFSGKRFAKTRTALPLPYRATTHKSVLLRKLGDADMRLQHNKVTNLRLAAQGIDRILIKPGETFSFWKLVGRPSAQRGFLPGMLLSGGEVIEGVGGGLCQMANLLYWMALHSPLTVTERYRHSFDPFPDSGRVLPFASGATIFYNYVDLQFRNDTQQTFEIVVWLDETFLQGEIRSDQPLPETYKVVERNHRFLKSTKDGKHYRSNELYKLTLERATGKFMREELISKNFCEMKYEPPADAVVEITE